MTSAVACWGAGGIGGWKGKLKRGASLGSGATEWLSRITLLQHTLETDYMHNFAPFFCSPMPEQGPAPVLANRLSLPPPPQPLPLPQPRPPCAMPPPGLSGNCEPLCMCVWVYGIVVYSCGHRSRSSWLPPIVAVSIAVSSQFATNSPNHPTTQPPRHPLSPQPPTQSPARCNYFNKFKPQRNNKQFVFRLKCNFHNFLCKDMANGQRITTTIPNILHPFRGKLLQTDWVVEPSTSHNYYLFYLYAGALIFHRVFPTDQFFFPSTCTRCCCCAFLLLLLLLLFSQQHTCHQLSGGGVVKSTWLSSMRA